MELDEIERSVTSRRERKGAPRAALPSVSMAGRATVGELKEHEHEPTKTGSWRVRLAELIPRACLPSYLGMRGAAADPGLLPEAVGGSRLPTGVPAYACLRFESPLPPGAPVCAEWRAGAAAAAAPAPAPEPEPHAIPVEDVIDDSNEDDVDIGSLAAAYGLDGIADDVEDGGPSFADSREVFLSAQDWDEIADDLIAAEEEFFRTPEASDLGDRWSGGGSDLGDTAFADFLDRKFGESSRRNINKLLSSYFKTPAADVGEMVVKPAEHLVKDLGKGVRRAGEDVGKGVRKAGEEVKKMTLNNPVKDGIESIINRAQSSARGAKGTGD